jgi:hypothetical protein
MKSYNDMNVRTRFQFQGVKKKNTSSKSDFKPSKGWMDGLGGRKEEDTLFLYVTVEMQEI